MADAALQAFIQNNTAGAIAMPAPPENVHMKIINSCHMIVGFALLAPMTLQQIWYEYFTAAEMQEIINKALVDEWEYIDNTAATTAVITELKSLKALFESGSSVGYSPPAAIPAAGTSDYLDQLYANMARSERHKRQAMLNSILLIQSVSITASILTYCTDMFYHIPVWQSYDQFFDPAFSLEYSSFAYDSINLANYEDMDLDADVLISFIALFESRGAVNGDDKAPAFVECG